MLRCILVSQIEVASFDGQEQDGLVVTNKLQLGLAELRGEEEFFFTETLSWSLGQVVELLESSRIPALVVLSRPKISPLSMPRALVRILPEGLELSVEVAYGEVCAIPVETHDAEVDYELRKKV